MSLAQTLSVPLCNNRFPKACRRCAAAKIRCTQGSAGDSDSKCDRCTRLRKECVPQDPSPPRKRRKKQTRVAQLEQKLDGLISLLGNVEDRSSSVCSIETEQISAKSPQTSVTSRSIRSVSSPKPNPSEFPELQKGYDGAEELLDHFRSKMAVYFPFIVIPPEFSPNGLWQNSPMLYQVVMLVTSYHHLFYQRAMEQAVREKIANKMLFHGEKSLDLLKSLLLLLSWFQYYSCSSSQMTNLLHMAKALVLDLGLSGPPDRKEKSWIQLVATRVAHGERVNSTTRTNDERRALLGSFYLHSVSSVTFKVIDSPVFTQYMGECCEALLLANEYDSDIQLVNLIRLQSALSRTSQNFQSDSLDLKVPDVPVHLYIKMIQAEIDQYKQTPAPSAERDLFTYLGHRITEVFLFENASVALKRNSQPEYEGFRMMEMLYSCAQSIQRFFDAFLSMPPANYYNLPLVYWAQAGIALMALARINFLDHEAWITAEMTKTVEGTAVLDRVIENMSRAKKEANLPDNGFFDLLKKRMEMIRTWFASQNSTARSHTSVPGTTESVTHLEAQAADISLSLIDFNAPGFWDDISSPFLGTTEYSMWRDMYGGSFENGATI